MVLAKAQNLLIEEHQKQIRLNHADKMSLPVSLKRHKEDEASWPVFYILCKVKKVKLLKKIRMMCLKSPLELIV